MQELKRKLNAALMLLPITAALGPRPAPAMGRRPEVSETQRRFNGLGLTLVVDAVAGVEMLGNEFFDDGSDRPFYASSVTRLGNRATMAFPGGSVPDMVRVVWRDSSKIVGRADNPKVNTYAGAILGDYAIPVASRIPDDVVREIRKNGGGLRLKFRLMPTGVLLGWDIERFSGGLPLHIMPGGDFREAGPARDLPGTLAHEAYTNEAKPYLATGEYFVPPRSADIWHKGWYIDGNGRKVLTDF